MSYQEHGSRRHPAVTVTVGEWGAEIDLQIAPLIRELWIAGIDTLMSCQEVSPGIAWIDFPDVHELLRFLDLVTWYEDGIDTFYNRVTGQRAGFISLPPWEYQLDLLDVVEDREVLMDGMGRFDATVGVYFPIPDIAKLTARLQAQNARGEFPESE